MKPLAILGGVIVSACLAHASTPKMWVKDGDNRVPLRIDSIVADITLSGSYAETVLTLRFRNETPRFQEGEFVMPLPDGATVSRYALEVNGSLRNAVAVGKHQARHAYETIKARKIDPGLVEREANNTYRTRVYPIPGNGTKLVRIGYIERIPTADGKLRYTLPTDYPGKVDMFACRVHHSGEAPAISGGGLKFTKKEPGLTTATAKDVQLKGNITISLRKRSGTRLTVEKHPSRNYFLLDFDLPGKAVEKPRDKPGLVHLIWDASASCRGRDVRRELELLDQYFRHIGNTRVVLKLLRNKLHKAGKFRVTKGNWQDLRKALGNTFYDGSSAFHLLRDAALNELRPQLTILVTDGADSERIRPCHYSPTVILHRSNRQHLRRLSAPLHGGAFNLALDDPAAAFRSLTHTRFRIKSVKSGGAEPTLSPNAIRDGRASIAGTCRRDMGRFRVTYENGNEETLDQIVRVDRPIASGGDAVRRIWAQQRLLALESEANKRNSIIAHCREHNLVSGYTSLIVLERFTDYVEFNIPPPEPHLRRTWEAVRKRDHSRRELARRLDQAWIRKVRWNRRSFSWLPHGLIAKYRQTEIWLGAMDTAFAKKDIDQRCYGTIDAWKNKTSRHIRRQPEIRSSKAFKQWLGRHDTLVAEWRDFQKLQPAVPPGRETAVSIRGLVNHPATYRFAKPPTLKQSVSLAGGLFPRGSLQSVSLYRNAHATTYNVASKRYQDIALLPGDMVVVGHEPYDFSGFSMDPFGDESGPAAPDASSLPPVAEHSPQVPDQADPFGGDSESGGQPRPPSAPRAENAEITRPGTSAAGPQAPVALTPEQWAAFETAVAEGNVNHAYRAAVAPARRPLSDYTRLARALAKAGHRSLAAQALSNIPENASMSPASLRAFAYWLAELKLWKDALAAMRLPGYPKDTQHEFDRIRIRFRNVGKNMDAADWYDRASRSTRYQPTTGQQLLALTERNSYAAFAGSNRQRITADIRCVAYAADPDAGFGITVSEPMDNTTGPESPSRLGGRIYRARGISEYVIRNAMPGSYTIRYTCKKPTTVQCLLYRDYGTARQSCEWITVLATPGKQATAIVTTNKEFPEP